MHRIDSDTKSEDLFGAGKHGFAERDPENGVAATAVTDDILNALQEELSNLIEAQGITLVKGTRNQLATALRNPVGEGVGEAIDATGGPTNATALKGIGGGPDGSATQSGHGVEGVGSNAASGVAGAQGGIGVKGIGGTHGGGTGTYPGPGVEGTGGTSAGVGTAGGKGIKGTGGEAAYGGAGVVGTGGVGAVDDGGTGVVGTGGSGGSGGAGVIGTGGAFSGIGVKGVGGNTGYGVVAESDTTTPSKAAFRIVPQDTEPTGPNLVGDFYVKTGDQKLYICTAAGTPGTWAVVGSQA